MASPEQDGHQPQQDADELDDYDSPSAIDEPDIQELLDAGYAQLDGFVDWLETRLGVDTRTAQQDCFNAESFVDYLANQHQKAANEVNEFELRWFVFSHYIRKSIADRESQERLPESLGRFYGYLQSTEGMSIPDWISATLDDQLFYLQRLKGLQDLASGDEAEWKTGFRDWCEELANDLDTRCLWLPDDMGEGMAWGELMGWRESALRSEANRLWQQERDELLANGLSFEATRDRLGVSYLLWLDTPQEKLDGDSPRQTILQERRDSIAEPDDDTEDEA